MSTLTPSPPQRRDNDHDQPFATHSELVANLLLIVLLLIAIMLRSM